MSASDNNAPPSYTEAMAQHQGSEQDEPRPDGWVEGYVEAPRPDLASTRTVSEQSMDDKEKVAMKELEEEPAVSVSDGDSREASALSEASSSSNFAFGGLTLGGSVLGFVYGNDVHGSGIKIGPLLLGLVERPGKAKGNAEEDE